MQTYWYSDKEKNEQRNCIGGGGGAHKPPATAHFKKKRPGIPSPFAGFKKMTKKFP